jgi:subtilisin family serine protease
MTVQPGLAADRASSRMNAQLPVSVEGLKLDAPLVQENVAFSRVDPALLGASGQQQVIVRLRGASVGKHPDQSPAGRVGYREKLKNDQSAFLRRANKAAPGAKTLASTQLVLNAVFMEVDASQVTRLASDPAVQHVHKVKDYELYLSETVPYIGATSVQAGGFDGSGVKVAVLDSGIDYTHAHFGGSGDPADFDNNDPTVIEPGTFPTAKVVGGYDFTGSQFPFGPVLPDPDPLDDGPGGGHGTHVADIIGGIGPNLGVAPGVDLYAVKVCSSVSSSCSGIALINGMEFAADPNGDGNPKDRVDIINMSLGSDYGQPFDDDLSAAVDGATGLGILTVASAGNGGDKPYITGSPAAAPTALSVAQTQVPSAGLQFLTVDGVDYQAVFQPWSVPPAGVITGPVQYGDGAGGNLNGCAPFAPGSLAGLVVLVDRGACNFTLKISNISQAGGLVGVIGLVAPGDPFSGGDGGDRPIDIPGYMISQADSNAIKAQIGNPGIATVDPDNRLSLVGTVVGSSSRGPQHDATTLIKPEIGAPGASVSAIAGSGTGEGPFGGTSGASPMVAGSAALVLHGFDTNQRNNGKGKAKGLALSPLEIKAILMNNGEVDIDTDPLQGLAPITRIGGGEVRVDRAVSATAAAWEDGGTAGALSFGFVNVADGSVSLTKRVRLKNYTNTQRNYTVTPTFRFVDDEATGAVSVSAPSSVSVAPGFGSDTVFDVTVTIDGANLRGNSMNSGALGANPGPLTEQEYDGYLVLDDGEKPLHLAWHVLPRKAARVVPSATTIVAGSFPQLIGLDNTGVGTAQNDAYALLAVSPNLPSGGPGEQSPTPDIRAVGVNTFPVPAGFCSSDPSFIWAFAVNTWEPQQHLLPVAHLVSLDVDQDGADDYIVGNGDLSGGWISGSISDGRQVTWALNLNTGSSSAFFFAEHATNTGNTVMYICGEQVGLSGTDMLSTNVDMSVEAFDFYYAGPGDLVDGITVTPLGERFFGVPSDVAPNTNDPQGLAVYDFGAFPGNSPELGLMLITNGDRGAGNRGGATLATEALLFTEE